MEAHGRCALLVEDEFLIALETEAVLRDLGCRDIYSASSVQEALEAIAESRPDFAVVDINLGGEQSWPVLKSLAERQIPFAVATGYALRSDLLQAYGNPPVLRKPVTARMLADAVIRLKRADTGAAPLPPESGAQKSRST